MKYLNLVVIIVIITISKGSVGQQPPIVDVDSTGKCTTSYILISGICLNLDFMESRSSDEVVAQILEYQGINAASTNPRASSLAGMIVFEETRIDGTTDTISAGTLLETVSGNIYKVISGYEYEYEYRPDLVVFKSGNRYILKIENFNDEFPAECLTCNTLSTPISSQSNVVRSNIVSNFEGLDYGNVFELANGQIWRQTEAWIWYWYWINPEVLIYPSNGVYKMKVDNIDHEVTVQQIR